MPNYDVKDQEIYFRLFDPIFDFLDKALDWWQNNLTYHLKDYQDILYDQYQQILQFSAQVNDWLFAFHCTLYGLFTSINNTFLCFFHASNQKQLQRLCSSVKPLSAWNQNTCPYLVCLILQILYKCKYSFFKVTRSVFDSFDYRNENFVSQWYQEDISKLL